MPHAQPGVPPGATGGSGRHAVPDMSEGGDLPDAALYAPTPPFGLGGGGRPPKPRRASSMGVTAGSVLAARRLAGSAWICSGFSLSNESFAEPSAAEPAFSAVHSLQAARGWHAQNGNQPEYATKFRALAIKTYYAF